MSTQYEGWVGREESRTETLNEWTVRAMAATLDLDAVPSAGQALPPGWQWLFFNPAVRRSGLGVDGHPVRGGFLPPIELPRRMWAGSRVRYLADLQVGSEATRVSRIKKVENKVGKRGSLWFVTVDHSISCNGVVCVQEEQDIVYREASTQGAPAAPLGETYAEHAEWSEPVTPDSTLLFRYSALTFNGHRIHYDQTYARNEEAYPDLVVHGPLTATLLQKLACEIGDSRRLASFDFRGVSPLFVGREFRLEARRSDENALMVWARGPNGELAMSATSVFA